MRSHHPKANPVIMLRTNSSQGEITEKNGSDFVARITVEELSKSGLFGSVEGKNEHSMV